MVQTDGSRLYVGDSLDDIVTAQRSLSQHQSLEDVSGSLAKEIPHSGSVLVLSSQHALKLDLEEQSIRSYRGAVIPWERRRVTLPGTVTAIGIAGKRRAKVMYGQQYSTPMSALVTRWQQSIDQDHFSTLMTILGSGRGNLDGAVTAAFDQQYLWDDVLVSRVKNYLRSWWSPSEEPQPKQQQRLDVYCAARSQSRDVICQVNAVHAEERQEFADLLRRVTDTATYACTFAPYIILTGETKENTRLVHALENPGRRLGLQGTSMHTILGARAGSYRAIPELLQEVNGRAKDRRKRSDDDLPWHLNLIGVDHINRATAGEGISLAILDTGVDKDHPEIAHLFQRDSIGYNFVTSSQDVFDDNGHGTHVCGLVAGSAVGVAPAAEVWIGKVLSEQGYGSEGWIVRGIEWSVKKKVGIINMSLGAGNSSEMEEDVIRHAISKGTLVCAAAGNESVGPSYPASYDGVLSVAAVDRQKNHAYFSNVDPTVDIAAPGVDVVSSFPGGQYAAMSGTSMATPLVTGAAAAVASVKQSDGLALAEYLMEHAEQLGNRKDPENADKYGAGLVRPDQCLKRATHDVKGGTNHGRTTQ